MRSRRSPDIPDRRRAPGEGGSRDANSAAAAANNADQPRPTIRGFKIAHGTRTLYEGFACQKFFRAHHFLLPSVSRGSRGRKSALMAWQALYETALRTPSNADPTLTANLVQTMGWAINPRPLDHQGVFSRLAVPEPGKISLDGTSVRLSWHTALPLPVFICPQCQQIRYKRFSVAGHRACYRWPRAHARAPSSVRTG